jgi:putative PIN family toxin of toxin-antitoxin system
LRVVLDTNVLLAALMRATTPPGQLFEAWKAGRFTLISCEEQLDEIREVTRRDRIRDLIRPTAAGRMVNDVRAFAVMVDDFPIVDASPDPYDNYLLGIAVAGRADLLVSGDKRDLLALKRFGSTTIVTARDAIQRIGEE